MNKFFSVIVIFALFILSVGCGVTENPQLNQKPTQTEKPEKLMVWEEAGKKAAIDPAIKSFEQEYGIKVEVKEVGLTNIVEQIQQQGKEGNGPDVVTLGHQQIGQAVTQGMIMPIQIEQTVKDRFFDSSIKALTYKGVLFGLPKSVDTEVFMYNKRWMNTAPTTFDGIYTFSKEFTKGGYYGFLAPWDQFRYAQGILGGYGGAIFGEKDGIPNPQQLGLNNQGSVQGLTYIQRWYTEELIPKEIIGQTGTQIMDGLFIDGRVASTINQSSSISLYQNSGIDIGVAPIPTLPNGKPVKSLMSVKGWFVTPYAKNQTWAVKLTEWLSNPDNSKVRLQTIAEVPPIKAISNDPILQSNELAKAMYIQAQNAEPIPNNPEMDQVWNPMNRALQLTVSNRLTPQKALDEAVNLIQQQINQGKK